jgi:hypothetical protein
MSSTEVRSGLKYGWGLGVSGWDTEMDADLLQIGRVGLHLSVRNRTTTAPPGSPADGDTYIPAATATGAWAGHEDDVAVYSGWVAYLEDEAKLSAFAAGAWSAGVAL